MRRRMLLGADAGGGDTLVPPNNELWYVSNDGKPHNPMISVGEKKYFDATYLGTTYEDGLGKYLFDGEVTEIGAEDGAGAFCGYDSLYSLILPKSVQSWKYYTFAWSSWLVNLVIQDTIKNIPTFPFVNHYIKATTPPTISSGQNLTSNQKVYVPIESVDAYKSAAGWSTYASQIYGYDFKNNDLWSDIQKK